jgi:hypothetical protein
MGIFLFLPTKGSGWVGENSSYVRVVEKLKKLQVKTTGEGRRKKTKCHHMTQTRQISSMRKMSVH